MNFLVLTPDGVGSTYLQKSLTVYLNASGEDYYNTHELLNGVELDDEGNLYKIKKGYTQSVLEICELLKATRGKIVSRFAQYHMENRLAGKMPIERWAQGVGPKIYEKGLEDVSFKTTSSEILERNKKEDYEILYDTCNDIFDKIIYCVRDPFEYALSHSIQNITGKFNPYSIEEKVKIQGQDTTYEIDLEFMEAKLDQYKRYLSWVQNNFSDIVKLEYDKLHNNVDLVLSDLTGIDFDMRKAFGWSLQEYSTLLYKISLDYNPSFELDGKLFEYQKELLYKRKLYRAGMPIKMNTLEDKSKRVINFLSSVERYNNWTKGSNEFPKIWSNDISERIAKENEIYELVD